MGGGCDLCVQYSPDDVFRNMLHKLRTGTFWETMTAPSSSAPAPGPLPPPDFDPASQNARLTDSAAGSCATSTVDPAGDSASTWAEAPAGPERGRRSGGFVAEQVATLGSSIA
eukprot:gene28793-35750_t